MEALHTLLSNTLPWMSPPVRICLFALTVLLLVIFGLPQVLRLLGRGLEATSPPILLALTYPEFVTTTISRRLQVRLLPGTFAYGGFLGGLEHLLRRTGVGLQALGCKKRSFPKRTFSVAVLVVATVWYSGQAELSPFVEQRVDPVRAELTSLDSWLITGTWTPPPTASVLPLKCPPAPKKKSARKHTK